MEGQLDLTEDEAQAELLRVLCEAAGEEGEGLTRRELMRATNRSQQWVLNRLQKLFDEGRLNVARKRMGKMDGTSQLVPAYSLRDDRRQV